MSIGTIIIFLVYVYICLQQRRKAKEIQWKLFCLTIFISTFVNCGYAFKIGSVTITYNIFCQILYILATMLYTNYSIVRVRRKNLFSDILFLFALVAGIVVLQYSGDKPLIIPWTTRMDDVYYQLSRAEYPEFGYGNYLNLLYCIVFFVFLAMSSHFFYDDSYVLRLKNGTKKFFKFLTISMLVEFLINNIISPTLIRRCVRAITGIASNGYDAPQQRFGMYGILQFFNESSYFCIFIILYLILLVDGISKEFDEKWIILSIVALFLSGATSAWLVIPVAVLAIVKDALGKKSKNKILNVIAISIVLCLIVTILFLANSDYFSILISGMLNKLSTYLTGSYDSLAVSGSIRHMGNQYAYNAFAQSPLFGWGIGTMRAYGLLPGALGCFGIIGLVLIMKYLVEHCNLRLHKYNHLWVILLIAYSTSIFSVGYLYDPEIILITFPFNALINRKGKYV